MGIVGASLLNRAHRGVQVSCPFPLACRAAGESAGPPRATLSREDGYAASEPAVAEMYAAILGEPVSFDRATDKWIVWPSAGQGRDPREDDLVARGIRVVGYSVGPDGAYTFRSGS